MKPGLGGEGVIKTSAGRGVSVGGIAWEEEEEGAATDGGDGSDGGEGAVDMAGGSGVVGALLAIEGGYLFG